ncbi:hypothetical protein FB451DRAFT_1206645, partial [Mycena latifolia]
MEPSVLTPRMRAVRAPSLRSRRQAGPLEYEFARYKVRARLCIHLSAEKRRSNHLPSLLKFIDTARRRTPPSMLCCPCPPRLRAARDPHIPSLPRVYHRRLCLAGTNVLRSLRTPGRKRGRGCGLSSCLIPACDPSSSPCIGASSPCTPDGSALFLPHQRPARSAFRLHPRTRRTLRAPGRYGEWSRGRAGRCARALEDPSHRGLRQRGSRASRADAGKGRAERNGVPRGNGNARAMSGWYILRRVLLPFYLYLPFFCSPCPFVCTPPVPRPWIYHNARLYCRSVRPLPACMY